MRNEVVFLESSLSDEMLPQIMILWLSLAFLASCSVASRPRGIRAEVNIYQGKVLKYPREVCVPKMGGGISAMIRQKGGRSEKSRFFHFLLYFFDKI